MILNKIYERFPDSNSCYTYLEELRWSSNPVCPYCDSNNYTNSKKTNRYHCNTCNTSYSVTVGTMFHKTKIDLQKWFYSLYSVMKVQSNISSRKLSIEIGTTKDTAWRIIKEIKKAIINNDELLIKIIEDEKK